MTQILFVMLNDHIPERAISAAVDAAGVSGDITFLRIFPTVMTEGFFEVEKRDRSVKSSEREEAKNILSKCIEYGKHVMPGEHSPHFSSIMREGVPLEVVSDLASSACPDIMIIPEKDSHKMGSFASGDLALAIGKRTSIPLRVVGGD